jgi:RsiW-degrading membrane proteinase PrsW (M82 family)
MDTLLFLAALPVFLIGLFIYSKDKNKEPGSLLFKLLLAGVGSVFLALFITGIIEVIIPSFENFDENGVKGILLFLYVVLGIGVVEEFSKWIFAYKISYNNIEFDELYDMIIYCVFVSLGFAFFENIAYVFNAGIEKGIAGGVGVGVVRALFSVPGHACDGVFMGYYLGLAKLNELQGKPDLTKKYKVLSLAVPALIHGIYDYLLFVNGSYSYLILFLVLVVTSYIVSIKNVNKVSSINEGLYKKESFCSNCGTKIKGKFCPNCGKQVQ